MAKAKEPKKAKKPVKAKNPKNPKKAKKAAKYQSFSLSIETDSHLQSLRRQYADASPHERRMAAQWEYDAETAEDIFNSVLMIMGGHSRQSPEWPPGFLALAIDPLHAPSLLTVGSVDYQHGFVKEAMELFLTLTTLPEDEEELHEIIDKAGDFLLDQEDYENALELYLSAETAYPDQALYPIGSSYCHHHLGNLEEAIRKARRAVELEPDDYRWLNDLGSALVDAGYLEEAEKVLRRSIDLFSEYNPLARENLKRLSKMKRQAAPSHA
ncbi:MAG: tetratricopeptide repeat protein [Pseudomonadota bacterium]